MFLQAKRREEGHDFYTEGFPATIQFIRDQLAEVCREADFFVYFLSLVSFAYIQPKTKHLIFSFQKRRTSRELCHSFTGRWESLARITSFRCPMRAPCL